MTPSQIAPVLVYQLLMDEGLRGHQVNPWMIAHPSILCIFCSTPESQSPQRNANMRYICLTHILIIHTETYISMHIQTSTFTQTHTHTYPSCPLALRQEIICWKERVLGWMWRATQKSRNGCKVKNRKCHPTMWVYLSTLCNVSSSERCFFHSYPKENSWTIINIYS